MKKNNDGIRMFKYFKQVKGSLILLVFLTLLFCVINFFDPIVKANLLVKLTNLEINSTILFALFMIGLHLFNLIVSYIYNIVYIKKIKQKLILNIRKDIIKNVFNMEIMNFDKHSSGEFTNRISNDPDKVSSILSVVQISFLKMITNIFIVFYIVYLNYILGIVYIVCIVLIFIYERLVLNKIKKLSEEKKKVEDKNMGILNEVLRGIRDIKVLNITRKTHNLMIKGLDEQTRIDGEKNIKSTVSYDIVSFMQAIAVFLVVLIGIFLVKDNKLSITSLIIIFSYKYNVFELNLCYRSIKEYLNEYLIASKRIFELMDNKEYPKESFGNIELKNVEGKIEIKDLSFSYGKKEVLNHLNLTIKPNDTIGIVGESGSGKTTILNLLSKSYNVENGKIFIDGNDINDLTKDSIRNNIAVISQNPYIFNLTIKENLELVGDDISKEDIVNACKVAQIHDYIMSLPNDYNTLLGEGGTTLSGGQKQRLAIARALLKKSKIILFDEATSALDNVTQNELQKSLNNISNDYTMIIVAHRLSTIKDCDKIFILDKGKIVGTGNHKELLKNNKQYKKLYNEKIE